MSSRNPGGGVGAGKKPLTKYERRAARQRQLDAMEASASGTATSMNLETTSLDNRGSGRGGVVSMRQRNQETARKFLYDEDDAAAGVATTGPHSMKNTSTASSLFVGRTAASGRDGMTTVNLMDHETGVYTDEDRSAMGRLRRFLFGPDAQSQLQPMDHHDAIAADTEIQWDTQHPRASRVSTIVAKCTSFFTKCRYFFCHSTQRMLMLAIFVVLVVIAYMYTMAVMKAKNGPTAEQILRAQNTDRFLQIMDHIVLLGVGNHETFADFPSAPARALRWIAYSDPAKLDPADPFIVQRFALAAFFYNSYWQYILTVRGKGTQLDKGQQDQSELVPNSGWYNQKNWLSGKGYCSWYGVQCDIKQVDGIDTRTYDDNANIYSISLSNNYVHGNLVDEFKAFHSLERLDFTDNRLAGNFTPVVRYMPVLRYLKLERNRLVGTIPPEIGFMQSALEIHLAHNLFTGTLPTEINRLSTLRILDISFNKFRGDFPDVRSLSNLRVMQMSNNQFDGTVPFSFAHLVQIQEIYMERNNFTGTIAPEYETFRHLQVFSAYENQITGRFPNGMFQSNLELRQVMIHKNQLRGSIPSWAGRLQELQTLEMQDNFFTGTFPTQWVDMPKLEILHLQNNNMHGTLPSTIGHLKELRELWLSNNTLTGPIPPEVGDCDSLEFAYFDANQFNETLPTQMGFLKNLTSLRVENNQMSGSIPAEVCNLKSFEALKFLSDSCTVECSCCNKCF